MPARDPRTVEQKFFAKLAECSREGDCILWPVVDHYGYGYFYAEGRQHRAHVVSLVLSFGEPAEGREAMHSCDNPSCVNPLHLSFGAHVENMADMVARGRSRGFSKGSHNSGTAKLTPKDVLTIRAMYGVGIRQSVIAKTFGVSQSNVSSIVLRKTWSHI